MKKTTQAGYSLLEVILAVGLASFFFTGALGLFLTSNRASAEGITTQQALWYAQEGLWALQSIDFSELQETSTGSLNFASNQWVLGTSGPDTLDEKFSRTVEVASIQRNEDCAIVESGGEIDTDTYILTSNVEWTDLRGQTQEVEFDSLRTNWENPSGACMAVDCTQLEWDVLNAVWSGGKQLREIYVTNNTGETKSIDTIEITWDNAAELQQIFFDNSKVWSASGPGSPTGSQTSGTVIDVVNADVADTQTIEMHKTQYTGNMEGTTISMTFTCTDGSSISFGPFTPSY